MAVVDSPIERPAPKIDSLESIRGLAATLVVFHHVPDWNAGLWNVRFIRNGYLMVDLFFVLSGFVIYRAYGAKIRSFGQLLRFQFLRLGRLYPTHLLFLAIFVLIELSKYFAQTRYGMAMPNSAPFRESNGVALIEQLFLVQAIGPTGNSLTFNSAAWSISVEFYTYVVFGLTVLFADRAKHAIFAALAAAALALLITRTTFDSTVLLRCIAGFFSGCLTAALAERMKARLHPALSVAVFVTLLVFLQFKPDNSFDPVTYLLSAALILTLVCSGRGWLRSALGWKAITWLGTVSYSIYMSQTMVVWVVNQVFRVVLKAPAVMREDRMTPQLPVVEAAVGYLIVVGCVLLISQITYKLVEAPFREWSRDLVFRGKPQHCRHTSTVDHPPRQSRIP
jgi:peptidoglycan/LPS O-acetylase OafA/YrhL